MADIKPIPVPLFPFPWKQGEHMVVIGSTGTGKTTLIAQLLQARQNIISLVTKADDSSKLLPNDVPKNRHLKHVSDIGRDPRYKRFVVEPDMRNQASEVMVAYSRAWKDGGWCIFTDELYYVEQELKLGHPNRMLLTQGRSKGITVVNGIQRPAWVSRFAISEPTHVLCARMEGRDVATVAEATSPQLKQIIPTLARYEFVWYYRPENVYARITLERIQGKEPR